MTEKFFDCLSECVLIKRVSAVWSELENYI